MAADAPIMLFDGVCNLCNRVVRFVIAHDPPPARFRFAALQSETGQALLRRHGLPTDDFDSFVLLEGDRVSVRSSAALHVVARLGFPWSLLAVLLVLPAAVRDPLYRWIAGNRYRWFGRRDACMVPTPELRSRFLP
ncbi:MAG TPA: thiol-disulfide oxidoreductase DCC family protein [Candidatus Binatia bacterium]|nr:thiol-disulfide oxidoreductase DCC family protein [Candidatus Binatia bacterium]